ncbi:GNAT family N-acetyltransferase [Rossellomorea sp. BNER]|uniref:GNAT family N-acetyltransferase n=1 Tax=Rossellomorea sp. BNER TaxID=2962031 RepID=UPI003AF28AEA
MEYLTFTISNLPLSLQKKATILYQEIFQSDSDFINSLEEKKNPLINLAIDSEKVIGFKVGYDRKLGHFYSWLGGVHPSYRGQGIASVLMTQQHEWCINHGYKTIQTKTKNIWKSMLILNLKSGFNVIGTYTDDKGEPKIILEKKL